jgi:signal transduction protein with GAF and PtsI domain
MTDEPKLSSPGRLRAVRRSGLLDSPPDNEFDRLAALAARLLHAPSAFVTVIAEDRQYLKSAVEEGGESRGGSSTTLDMSFCKHTVAAREPFIVSDAREHPLVRDNPAVRAGVIAYAGIPLETTDGEAIGALCVVDSRPRDWSRDDIETLRVLARSAMKLIDERSEATGEGGSDGEEEPQRLIECISHHLRATDFYAHLLSTSKKLDLGAEAAAREEVVRTLRGLRRVPGEWLR